MRRVGLVYLKGARRRLESLRWHFSQGFPWLPELVTVDHLVSTREENGTRAVAVWVEEDQAQSIKQVMGEPWRTVRSLKELEQLGFRVVESKTIGQMRLKASG
ncbi:MAG: hypothetical protein QXP81_01520 [Nitrososphaerota archaeon]